jgi:hypothetical protein
MIPTLTPPHLSETTLRGLIPRFKVSDPDLSQPLFREKRADLSQIDWNQVNRIVQREFRTLAGEVRRRWPHIRARAGRTSGRVFFLFAYCTFDVPEDHGIDPVVVGINFGPTPHGGAVVVQGDISGEESGKVYYELPPREVPNQRVAILVAAREIARDLSNQADSIGENLVQANYPPSD